MSEPLAYLNGKLIPASSAGVPLHDTGFVLGVTVAEQLRTFSGRIFHLEDHLARLRHSLEIVGIDRLVSFDEIADAARKLVVHNHALLQPGDDLGLSIFVTPGPHTTYTRERSGPSVGLHTYLLPFHLWVRNYDEGVPLVTTEVEQVPSACWPRELKCRSRMHYYLADRLAYEREPGAKAILTDGQGHVLEASTANLVMYRRQEGLISPPRAAVLPGITLEVVRRLSQAVGIPFQERPIRVEEVGSADELILTSTPYCLLPATRFNGHPIAGGLPGEVFRSLIAAWNRSVGLDVVEQARQFFGR